MWAAALAHNGLLGTGRVTDWASHRLEHELSALYDIAHGAGLAIVFPAWMKYVLSKGCVSKLRQFAVRRISARTKPLLRKALPCWNASIVLWDCPPPCTKAASAKKTSTAWPTGPLRWAAAIWGTTTPFTKKTRWRFIGWRGKLQKRFRRRETSGGIFI